MTSPAPDPKLLDALKARGDTARRYQLRDEVARGGMGIVLRVWDEDLRRHLAMKVMLGESSASPAQLARFLEEAQVTGQLDHPGIVPVHELGIDASGRVFFTMKLVKGITLSQVFAKASIGADGWNQTRALSAVLRVCEAMAFAHDKGVIHRDLKPANVMVGKFGETYVMDWGLARVLAEQDRKDIRLKPDISVVRTERRETAGDTPDSLLTMDGDLVGTPAYMPPEQAQGDMARVGPQSDIYAVGAILYHLLTGRVPYAVPDTRQSPLAILAQVLHGPPQPIHELTKDVPAELASICEKAMARALEQRYGSMTDLADDLRAYLENRVVKAYATGAFAEMKKWVRRNQSLAAAAAALVVVLAAATVVVARKNAEVEAKNVEITAKSEEVSARKAEFDQLSGVVLLETALNNEAELYPPWPHQIAAMQRWLADDAARLLAMKPMLTRTLAELEARAVRPTDVQREADRKSHPRFAELHRKQQHAAWLRSRSAVHETSDPPAAPRLPAECASMSAFELDAFAWRRIDPDFDQRTFGEEAFGLAAAQAAVARVEAGDASATLATTLDTLAWAFVANGRDADARATSQRALAATDDADKENYARVVADLERTLISLSGDAAADALRELDVSIAELETAVARRRTWSFADESQRFLHSTLARLAADLAAFESGVKADVDQRLAWAHRIGDLSLHHPNASTTWEAARRALAQADGVVASTLYRESPIDLQPQMGLVPIGMNPVTKLWEFYELSSACDLDAGVDPATVRIPTHASDGSIEVNDDTGIVFVLIPGGTFVQGAQKDDPTQPNFDSMAVNDEAPHALDLAPYFFARHELTAAQWKCISGGETPSWYQRGRTYGMDTLAIGWTHPVEQVSWADCERCLRRAGLALPTEAQWERGARGTSTTPWWTGTTPESLDGAANLLDLRGERAQPTWGRQAGNFDDGFVGLAPVGRFHANGFGLFDVHGNVWEWCLDTYGGRYGAARPGDGLRTPDETGPTGRVSRGGGFRDAATGARCALRTGNEPSIRYNALGVRAARAMQQ